LVFFFFSSFYKEILKKDLGQEGKMLKKLKLINFFRELIGKKFIKGINIFSNFIIYQFWIYFFFSRKLKPPIFKRKIKISTKFDPKILEP
jgi:hypothetical protein